MSVFQNGATGVPVTRMDIIPGILLTFATMFLIGISDICLMKVHRDRKIKKTTGKCVMTNWRWCIFMIVKYGVCGGLELYCIYLIPEMYFTAVSAFYPCTIIIGSYVLYNRKLYVTYINSLVCLLLSTSLLMTFTKQRSYVVTEEYIQQFFYSNSAIIFIILCSVVGLNIFILYSTRFNNSKCCIRKFFSGKSPDKHTLNSGIFYSSILVLLSLLGVSMVVCVKIIFTFYVRSRSTDETFSALEYVIVTVAVLFRGDSMLIFDVAMSIVVHKIEFTLDHYSISIAISEILLMMLFRLDELYPNSYLNIFYIAILLLFTSVYSLKSKNKSFVQCGCMTCCRDKIPCLGDKLKYESVASDSQEEDSEDELTREFKDYFMARDIKKIVAKYPVINDDDSMLKGYEIVGQTKSLDEYNKFDFKAKEKEKISVAKEVKENNDVFYW